MNVTIRGRLWQLLWWPRLKVAHGTWPRPTVDAVFQWWIVGPFEVRRYFKVRGEFASTTRERAQQ